MESSTEKSFSDNYSSCQICVCHNARQFKYLDEYHSKRIPPGSWFATLTIGLTADFPAYGISTDHCDNHRDLTVGNKPVICVQCELV